MWGRKKQGTADSTVTGGSGWGGSQRACEREIGQGREKLEESEERKSWEEGGGAFKSGVEEIDYTEVKNPRSGGAKSRGEITGGQITKTTSA